jgi:hypothetical protein
MFYIPTVCNFCVIVKPFITFYLHLHKLLIGTQEQQWLDRVDE